MCGGTERASQNRYLDEAQAQPSQPDKETEEMMDSSSQNDYSNPTGSGPRRSLRRVRSERMLFGVCGGIARYFDLDPTLVRVGFALVGLIPPVGGTLLMAYLAMALIVPEEDAEVSSGRAQVQDNLASLRRDVSGLAERIRAKVTREPTTGQPAAEDEWREAGRPSGMGRPSEVVRPSDQEIVTPRGTMGAGSSGGSGGSSEESRRESPETRVT
jgi:phage shock protein PspC (stress-responsive transcriptional regulator)